MKARTVLACATVAAAIAFLYLDRQATQEKVVMARDALARLDRIEPRTPPPSTVERDHVQREHDGHARADAGGDSGSSPFQP